MSRRPRTISINAGALMPFAPSVTTFCVCFRHIFPAAADITVQESTSAMHLLRDIPVPGDLNCLAFIFVEVYPADVTYWPTIIFCICAIVAGGGNQRHCDCSAEIMRLEFRLAETQLGILTYQLGVLTNSGSLSAQNVCGRKDF